MSPAPTHRRSRPAAVTGFSEDTRTIDGGTLTFLGHAGAEVDAMMATGGVQIWLA